jgi:hypothetical protein
VGIAKKGTPPGTWQGWKFLVTAEHVIGNRDAVILRLNRKDAVGFVCFRLDLLRRDDKRNVFSSSKPEVDLIAVSLPDIADSDPTVFDYSLTMSKQFMNKAEVQVGTEVYMIGYLFGYAGQKQNYPITRFGKVALLTEEQWYHSPRKKIEQAYLVEMQSISGLSGAPVILQSSQIRVNEKGQLQHRLMPAFILGVNKGTLLSPLGGTQGVAAIEPGYHLQDLLRSIADALVAASHEVELVPLGKVKE